MRTKAENPASLLAGKPVSAIVRLYFDLAHLKQVYRRGWLERDIPPERCESVAEHSYAVAILALLLSDHFPHLDLLRVLELALLHDFGEIDAGDITPADGVSREEKQRRELASLRRVLEQWPGRDRYLALYDEYLQGKSAEARFVHQLEKLEMALQAAVYQRQGLAVLGEFLASAEQAVEDDRLKLVLADLRQLFEE